ncbi:hypothetical protein M3Y95_00354500 [Aphelenchoides besseyi]|nr:hypothetical protein M3Y95_00354500 [Aphelenchoides besseyi]
MVRSFCSLGLYSFQLVIDRNAAEEGKRPECSETSDGPVFPLVGSVDGPQITRVCFRLQENREQLKEQGFKGSDAAKEGGRLWRELGDKSEWESKAADLKKNYEKEMMAYNAGK